MRAHGHTELTQQEWCQTLGLNQVDQKLTQIENAINADIDAATNLAENKVAMKQSFHKLLVAMQKLGRCQISALRLRGGPPS